MSLAEQPQSTKECQGAMLPIKDALEVLSGKWKLPIMIAIMHDFYRFKEISKNVNGITDRMLSKELKELEMNKLVVRKVIDSFPPRVEYMMTPHGQSLKPVLVELAKWGSLHRKKIMGGA